MPKLTLLVGRKPLKIYDVNATVVRIGREAELDVVIDNVAVSRRQAEIRLEGADWILPAPHEGRRGAAQGPPAPR